MVSNPEVRIGQHGSMLVSVWYAQASLGALQALAEEQRKLVARYGSISTLSIAMRVPRAPGPEATEWIKQTDQEFRGTTRGSVVVVMERGLAAIIVRSFLAAASLITTNVMHVVNTIEEAAAKVQALPGQPPELVGHTQLAQKLATLAG